ncbi:ATP-grasp domain-containing protein [Microbacterium sp. ISL-59]|uniref:ATP-grasp domain-containing protein n=1 Tax=Microbacterium sp. ISL-59 TaxID=2819159 RepID=UPI001BE7F564|nr:ATP-grasp domain-containing protein [Microbacterium sp. ISL-59]MBT2495019.1 ATP-grasp domain-containing protein [Microbacterium sp. ISL-59]
MDDSQTFRIVIGSAGRRIYLHDWFEKALSRAGVSGEVHVTDADARSATYSHATHRHLMPAYASDEYFPAMVNLADRLRPALLFSVNDYEIEALATSGLGQRITELGTEVLGVPGDRHHLVHDKLLMSRALTQEGIATPRTVLLTDLEGLAELARSAPRIIIKDRFGSGSSGLINVAAGDLSLAVEWATRSGGLVPDGLIAQPALEGIEFGLDVVAPLKVGAHPVAVLARRKLRMRSGETDQAISADASPFLPLGERLTTWLGHRGSVDVDVIVADDGVPSVIDINPRFGGGYPFNHLAGADLPALFVAQLNGGYGAELGEFLRYDVGVASSKYEAIVGAAE